jgi:hypothetical protein
MLFLVMVIFSNNMAQPRTDYIDKLTAQYSGSGTIFVLPAIGSDGNCEIIIERDPVYKYFQINESKHYSKFSVFIKSLIFDKKKYDLRRAPKTSFIKVDEKSAIKRNYQSRGLKYIIKTYLNNDNGRFYAKDMYKKDLPGLISIMFKNEYFVYFSGYSGQYTFSKSVLR